MARYLFDKEALASVAGATRKYDVLDLVQTQPLLADALEALARTAAAGRAVLFVGTTPAARQARCNDARFAWCAQNAAHACLRMRRR